MFMLIIVLLLLSNIFGYSTANYKPKYGVTNANVNFRNSTTLSSSTKIKSIAKNTNLKMVGEISNFYIVQLSTNEVGLISKEYIKIQENNLSSAKTYESFSKYYATINDDYTKLRGGPGTSFRAYISLDKGTKVQVIGKIDSWYLVVTEQNTVGMIRQDLITKVATTTTAPSVVATPSTTTTSNEDMVLNLINKARRENGITELNKDATLANVAQIKSDDMVKNNYFSHTSPSYGTPFAMMQGFGISYKTAGENIAGNPSITKAVEAWLNSETHRKNILSNLYNYVGIGVTKSNTYGFVISTMFIGK
jgi:uncharacterized YkwD family protein